jgi:MFS family permease
VRVIPVVFRYRDFRLFAGGTVLSALGTQFTIVAMAWQIYQLTNSPFQVGLLGLGRALPQIALTLFGGLLADALDRRRLMMAIQLCQCVVSASLAALTIAGLISPTALLAAALLLALGSAVETPNHQAIVPNLLPEEDLGAGIALNNTLSGVARIAGPSMAGVILAISGPTWCYVIDATSWFAMLSAVALIRRPLRLGAVSQVSVDAVLAGVRFVLTQPVILSFMILDFGATFFGSTTALLPVYARELLGVGPVGLGILYASPWAGAVLAGILLSGGVRVDRAGKWVLIGVAVYGCATMGFALSRFLWLSVLMLAAVGAGNAISAVLRSTSNQLLTPDELRGRVAAVNNAFVNGGPQLGQFESGVVASIGGAQLSALTGGLGALLLACTIALRPKVRMFTLSSTRSSSLQASTST